MGSLLGYCFPTTIASLFSLILCIYLFLAALGLPCCVGLPLAALSRATPSLSCTVSLRWWLLLLQSTGLAALQHVKSSPSSDRTHVSALAGGFLIPGLPDEKRRGPFYTRNLGQRWLEISINSSSTPHKKNTDERSRHKVSKNMSISLHTCFCGRNYMEIRIFSIKWPFLSLWRHQSNLFPCLIPTSCRRRVRRERIWNQASPGACEAHWPVK